MSNTNMPGLEEADRQPPLALSVVEAAKAANTSRTAIYEALQRKELKGKKRGRRTLILSAELGRYLASLPDYRS